MFELRPKASVRIETQSKCSNWDPKQMLELRPEANVWIETRVSSKQTKYIFGLNRNEPKHNLFRFVFRFVSWNQKKLFFGLFRCFEHVSKQPKQTKLFRKKPKKTKKNCKLCSSRYSIHWTRVGKHVQVQHRTLVDGRQSQVQNKALVDRDAQMHHRLLKTGTSRCNTKIL